MRAGFTLADRIRLFTRTRVADIDRVGIGATDKLVGELIAFCEHRCERLSPPLRVAGWARSSGFSKSHFARECG